MLQECGISSVLDYIRLYLLLPSFNPSLANEYDFIIIAIFLQGFDCQQSLDLFHEKKHENGIWATFSQF
jgi:hypothetical protein